MKKELTAMPSSNRWRKKYKGNIYYFAGCKSPTDTKGYKQALALWHQKKAQLEVQADEEQEEHRQRVNRLRRNLAGGLVRIVSKLGGLPVPRSYPEAETIGAAVELFIKHKQAQLDGGKIVSGRFDCARRSVYYFQNLAGKDTPLNHLNARTLEDYYTHLIDKVKKGMFSPSYAKTYLVDVKQFVRWAYETELLETEPRNLRNGCLTIAVHSNPIEVFKDDEVTKILAEAKGKMRLFLLLMLNCGMTQKDISDLRKDEVREGRVIRKRSKTARCGNVPTVNYKLWGETSRLLTMYRSDHPERILRSDAGGELKKEMFDETDNKLKKSDPIAKAFQSLQRKTGIKGSLKTIRKTAPSKLAEHPVYGRFVQHYLGHSPRSIADRSYVKPAQDLFDEAIAWLGQQYGIE